MSSTYFIKLEFIERFTSHHYCIVQKLEDVNRHVSKITGAEMRYLGKCAGETRRDRIRNSQIIKIQSEDLVTKMFDKRELRWFGHLISLIMVDSNRRPRQVWEKELRGPGEEEGQG